MKNLDSEYWNQRYQTGETGWDIGYASTPLTDFFDQLPDKNISILIPGCGNAYEGEYLYKNDFKNVFLIDIAPLALENVKKRFPAIPKSQLILEDFFEHTTQYDLIVEQTFFCALDPELRPNYAKQAAKLLKPGGHLAGVLFDAELNKDRPPFGGNKEEYKEYFNPYFNFIHFETAENSIKPRQGRELFINLQRK